MNRVRYPKSPKGWHKNAISLLVPVKFNFSRKKSATKFLCVKNFSGKVVATSFPYPTVHRSIAGDVPIYLKLAFNMIHPFKKHRFRKLSYNCSYAVTGLYAVLSYPKLKSRIRFIFRIICIVNSLKINRISYSPSPNGKG